MPSTPPKPPNRWRRSEVPPHLRDGLYSKLVGDSFMSGVRSGVNGMPTFFIDGIRYDGPRDEETLVAALELVADEARAT
jgi:protein-disulfide isomerase